MIELPQLNLPEKKFNIKTDENQCVTIFCSQRRKFVKLTPEEWVRQNMVRFMIENIGYPEGLIGNEIQIKVGNTVKRCDSIVYNKEGKPAAICEYKAPTVQLSQLVFNQIFRYNYALQVRFLIVSNGYKHYCCKLSESSGQFEFLQHFPTYQDLCEGSQSNE